MKYAISKIKIHVICWPTGKPIILKKEPGSFIDEIEMKEGKFDYEMIGLGTMGRTWCITAHTYARNNWQGIFHTH